MRAFTLDFLKTEAASGAILATAALAALILANSPAQGDYLALLAHPIALQAGGWREVHSLAEWVETGLMAVFFLVVGLEIKYEILKGELSNPRRLALPLIAAVGGMVVPAAVYLGVAGLFSGDPRGWSIPTATDIAFALAAFALVGRGLPPSLRVFLLTLAIADDLGAVAIIALAYTRELQPEALVGAGIGLLFLALLGRLRRMPTFLWALGFLVVWGFTLESGVSTSIAGVAAALTVPVAAPGPGLESPLGAFTEKLHPYVAYLVLPLFAFTASGFSFSGLTLEGFVAPVPLGIALGLFAGKQLGVLGATALAVRTGLARRPTGSTWLELWGVSALCGVGFTMSLFLGALALPSAGPVLGAEVKAGVLAGSLLAVGAGAALLSLAARIRLRREASVE